MNKLPSFLVILFFVCSCTMDWTNNSDSLIADSIYIDTKKTDSSISANDNNTLSDTLKWDWNGGRSHIFSEISHLYINPDTNSKILVSYPFNTQIYGMVENLKINKVIWYKIIREDRSVGYIREDDFATDRFDFYGADYGFLVGKKQKTSKPFNTIVAIRRFKSEKHEIMENYETSDLSDGFEISWIKNTTLKGAVISQHRNSRYFFCYRTYMESCPGTTSWEYIIDTGEKLMQVAVGFSEGEADYSNETSVYLPMRFGNGKILLVKNADVTNIFDSETASLNTLPYSESIGVKIENMVVIKSDDYIYSTDDDKEVIRDKFGYLKIKSNEKSINYFEWDGQKLNTKGNQ